MNEEIFVEAGLTDSQAKTYLFLVKNSPITPPALSNLTGEARSNTYKVLEQLEELNLAQRDESEKKIKYWALSPSALLDNAEEHLELHKSRAKKLKVSMPTLISEFAALSEKPTISYFQGKAGIERIFEDQISSGCDVTFVRSKEDRKLYGYEKMRELRTAFVTNNVSRKTFSPDSGDIPKNWKDLDKKRSLKRIFMRANDYTSSVEWAVYGNKLSTISYGTEAIGIIIESPQIAEGFRQLLTLCEEALTSRQDYNDLPTLANHIIAA